MHTKHIEKGQLCTRAPHSFLSFSHCRASPAGRHPSATQGHLKPCIQPNLSLPRTLPPLTSEIDILLTTRCSSTISIYPNYLNALWSKPLGNNFFYSQSFDHLFVPNFIYTCHSYQTSPTLHLDYTFFPSIPQHFSNPNSHDDITHPYLYLNVTGYHPYPLLI